MQKTKDNQGVASARLLLSNFKWYIPCRVYIICTRFLTKTIKQIATQNISNRSSAKKKSTKLCDKDNIKQIFKRNKSTKFFWQKKQSKKKSLKKETKNTAMAFPSAVAASIDLPFFSASKASYWLMVQKSQSNNHRVRMVKTLQMIYNNGDNHHPWGVKTYKYWENQIIIILGGARFCENQQYYCAKMRKIKKIT